MTTNVKIQTMERQAHYLSDSMLSSLCNTVVDNITEQISWDNSKIEVADEKEYMRGDVRATLMKLYLEVTDINLVIGNDIASTLINSVKQSTMTVSTFYELVTRAVFREFLVVREGDLNKYVVEFHVTGSKDVDIGGEIVSFDLETYSYAIEVEAVNRLDADMRATAIVESFDIDEVDYIYFEVTDVQEVKDAE